MKPALPETATAAPAIDPVLEELDPVLEELDWLDGLLEELDWLLEELDDCDWDWDWLPMKVTLETTRRTAGPFPTLTTTTFTEWVTF